MKFSKNKTKLKHRERYIRDKNTETWYEKSSKGEKSHGHPIIEKSTMENNTK